MIYVTGDIHGRIDIGRLSTKNLAKAGVEISADDYLIICGDFGLLWRAEPDGEEKWWLRWLDEKPWTTLFVDGNHENFARLNALPVEQWHGGTVHRISRKVLHLMRGQLYELEGHTLFTFGGAASHDKQWRTEGKSWWPEEMPSDEEKALGNATLDACGRKADYVFTHCAPSLVQGRVDPAFLPDHATEYLQYLSDTTTFSHWYCGHYHVDRDYADGFHVLYHRIVPLAPKDEGRRSAFLMSDDSDSQQTS